MPNRRPTPAPQPLLSRDPLLALLDSMYVALTRRPEAR
jgi:hypothetical protein